MQRIVLKMHRDIFVPTKTKKCLDTTIYTYIHCFYFHVSLGRDFGERASNTLHYASHFSAFYIHPRCEDDSSQL